jgi:hypothetical protein
MSLGSWTKIEDEDMSDVAEFIKIRQQIESLAKEIPVLLERKTMPASKLRLDEATELLAKLTSIADNDVQEVAVGRLTRLLASLRPKVGALETKQRVVKKPRPS